MADCWFERKLSDSVNAVTEGVDCTQRKQFVTSFVEFLFPLKAL